MNESLSRRELLGGLGLAGLTFGLGGAWPASAWARQPAPPASAKRVLRVAHITDVHVQPELKAGIGFAEALKKIGELPDQPDVIFNTGDSIMDSMDADEARTKLQWDLWQKCLKDGPRLPIEHCLGNHDIWGINKKKSKTNGDEAKYGKKWACEIFGVDKPYRRFDRAGWSFIVLDSVMPLEDKYDGKLDAEQMEWLQGELASIPQATPVMVLSHIPILTVTTMADKKTATKEGWSTATSLMMSDWPALRDLFRKHKNVKACISGHIHQVDRVEFEGVTYLCNGAVSGAWWKGKRHECDNGFSLLDLYADGRVEREYVETGWKPVKE